MKIHILSDLRFEFGRWPKGIDVNAIDADVTVLAGDIGVGLEGIGWALTNNRPVIYVMGNHEFYGQCPMNDLWRKAREKVADTHIHLLENESVLIDDPHNPGECVRFIGATLDRLQHPGRQPSGRVYAERRQQHDGLQRHLRVAPREGVH